LPHDREEHSSDEIRIVLSIEHIRPNQSMKPTIVHSAHVYEVRPREDKRGVDLISDALPFGRLWYDETERGQ
jgi:hypothetical protein